MYYVYIMTNYTNSVLYIGVTSNLIKRVYEHRNKFADSFTKKYNITKLVYFETTSDISEAIKREKQLKGGSRKKKTESINLILLGTSSMRNYFNKDCFVASLLAMTNENFTASLRRFCGILIFSP